MKGEVVEAESVVQERLVARPSHAGPSQAQPDQKTWLHHFRRVTVRCYA